MFRQRPPRDQPASSWTALSPKSLVRISSNVSSTRDEQQHTLLLVVASLALHLALALLTAFVVRFARVAEDAPPTVAMVFDAAPAPLAQAPVPKAEATPDEQPSAAPAQAAQDTPAELLPPPLSIEPAAAKAGPPSPDAAPSSELPSPEAVGQPEPDRQTAPVLPLTSATRAPKPPASVPAAPGRPRPAGHAAQQPSMAAVPAASLPAASLPVPARTANALPHLPAPASSAATVAAPASFPAAVNGAWRNALAAWVQSRKHYPDEARRQSTEGQVAVRFTIARDGQVLDAQIVHGSGSDLLDQAALSAFRGGRAPPFPADMAQLQLTTIVAIHYRLEE